MQGEKRYKPKMMYQLHLDDLVLRDNFRWKLDAAPEIIVQKIFMLSKRFFDVPAFFNYAMADGIFELLKNTKNGIFDFKDRIGKNFDDFQLSLFPD